MGKLQFMMKPTQQHCLGAGRDGQVMCLAESFTHLHDAGNKGITGQFLQFKGMNSQ